VVATRQQNDELFRLKILKEIGWAGDVAAVSRKDHLSMISIMRTEKVKYPPPCQYSVQKKA